MIRQASRTSSSSMRGDVRTLPEPGGGGSLPRTCGEVFFPCMLPSNTPITGYYTEPDPYKPIAGVSADVAGVRRSQGPASTSTRLPGSRAVARAGCYLESR